MKRGNNAAAPADGADKAPKTGHGFTYYAGFALLLTLYAVASVFTHRVSRSAEVIQFGQAMLPVSAFTGVITSFSNLSIIYMVVIYKKPGYVTALAILLVQYPIVLREVFFRQNTSSIPGVFINSLTIITILLIHSRNRKIDKYRTVEIEQLTERQRYSHNLFEQTAEALANAIDTKDAYTNGHSQRVAEYSRKIAREVGKPEEECERIYFSALLHDVGKIGIPVAILNKPGRLTEEEFAQIKQHPVMGGQILSSIQQSPYLSIAARYHHERYDGKGYPDGLKGEDIPEIARIIAVADAYDAMTSNRSYREAIPQDRVREELVKGLGTQFDPQYAKAMIHLLDQDVEYRMRELESGGDLLPTASMHCKSIYHECTRGIPITRHMVSLRLYSQPDEGFPEAESLPSLILFDALDGRIHPGEENNKDLLYYEYARIRLDGRVEERGTRRAQTTVVGRKPDALSAKSASGTGRQYAIEAVKCLDHALVRISDGSRTIEVILALPDCSRFAYVAITGEHCTVNGIHVESADDRIGPDYIPRIAEEVSYIKDCPEGDIPNVQVNNWCTETSESIPLRDDLKLSFHAKSLPTARLVWHCPYISVFSSNDGKVHGKGFREYILLRLDGENWESDENAENQVFVSRSPDFEGWNRWKERNREGFDCTAVIRRQGNRITIQTENFGLGVTSVTTIRDDAKDVFVALTGDQCALTNIRATADA